MALASRSFLEVDGHMLARGGGGSATPTPPRTSAHPSPEFTQPLSVAKLRPVSDGHADGHESEGGGVCPGPTCDIAAGGVTGGLHGMVGDVGDAISDLFSR